MTGESTSPWQPGCNAQKYKEILQEDKEKNEVEPQKTSSSPTAEQAQV
jgi:hypothetical protein